MGLLKTIRTQLGLSNTATQNFTLTAEAADGTMKLARGNAGATTQDIITVDSTGAVSMPNNLVAFDVYSSSDQTVTTGIDTKVQLNTKVFDTSNAFNTSNYRFTPQVSGYYQINIRIRGAASSTLSGYFAQIWKNGSLLQRVCEVIGPSTPSISGSALVYMNGTTDYLEFYGNVNGTGTCTFDTATPSLGLYGPRVSGYLVAKA